MCQSCRKHQHERGRDARVCVARTAAESCRNHRRAFTGFAITNAIHDNDGGSALRSVCSSQHPMLARRTAVLDTTCVRSHMVAHAETSNPRAIYVETKQRVLAEYHAASTHQRQSWQKHHEAHVCDQTCRLWVSKSFAACVCVSSSQVHLCGELCELASRPTVDGDTRVCPLTNRVLDHCTIYTQMPTFDAYSRTCVHWDVTKKKGSKRPKVRPVRHNALRVCTMPDAGRRRVVCAVHNSLFVTRANLVATVKVAAMRALPTTWEAFAACVSQARVPRPTSKAGNELACSVIADCIHSHMLKSKWMNSSVETTVAVYLTMMSTAWIVSGVTCVPHIPFVEAHLPIPIEMSQIPKVHCRAVSVGIRSLKRFMLTSNGTPVLSRVLLVPKAMRQALHRVETGSV